MIVATLGSLAAPIQNPSTVSVSINNLKGAHDTSSVGPVQAQKTVEVLEKGCTYMQAGHRAYVWAPLQEHVTDS